MNKKLMFRILGAIASSLIIVALFVPFVSVVGYSQNLWDMYSKDSLYLLIMIMVAGGIGVLFFSLNIKTEFAYMTTGAILFYCVMQGIEAINQGYLSNLSIGYYFLLIGSILTGVMAFLNNLRVKVKEVPTPIETNEGQSMINKIDNLYNDQTINDNLQQQIQPIQVEQTLEPIQPVTQVEPQIEAVPVARPTIEPIQQPVVEPINVQPVVTEPVQPVQPQEQNIIEPTPTIQQEVKQPVNPVIQEFANFNQSMPTSPIENPVNQFSFNTTNVNQNQNLNTNNINNVEQPVNPVVNDFINPSINQNTTNNTTTDIFGQPIDK